MVVRLQHCDRSAVGRGDAEHVVETVYTVNRGRFEGIAK
jgi:hypothetical protein